MTTNLSVFIELFFLQMTFSCSHVSVCKCFSICKFWEEHTIASSIVSFPGTLRLYQIVPIQSHNHLSRHSFSKTPLALLNLTMKLCEVEQFEPMREYTQTVLGWRVERDVVSLVHFKLCTQCVWRKNKSHQLGWIYVFFPPMRSKVLRIQYFSAAGPQQLLKYRPGLPGGCFASKRTPYMGRSPASLAALDGRNRISSGKRNTLVVAHQRLFPVTQRRPLARHETHNSCMGVDLRFTAWASYPIRLDHGGKTNKFLQSVGSVRRGGRGYAIPSSPLSQPVRVTAQVQG